MSKERKNVIWSIDRSKVIDVVGRSKSLADIFRHFGMVCSGTAYKILKKRMDEENIDYSHIPMGLSCNRGRRFEHKDSIPLEKIMVEGSKYCRSSLKRRLMKKGIIENKCSICKKQPEWEGKPLVLVLDHINGVNDDNRIENLRLVCPNCNSQLSTTTGRNRRKKNNCLKCGVVIDKKSKYCTDCFPGRVFRVEIEDRPTKEELEKMVGDMSMTAIGKKYGVSDNAIRKWCRRYGIELKKILLRLPDRFCDCGKKIGGNSKTGKCVECFRFDSRKVVKRPLKEELEKDISEMSVRAIGRKYGVARGTIHTWCRVYGI